MSETILLQIKNTHKSFLRVKTLQEVDLEPKAGEVHALLSKNGAGKSTLTKVLGGIYIAEEGETFIDGRKVTIGGANTSHNNEISIIHQELVLVPHMIVAENIFLGREPSKRLRASHEIMEKEAQQLLDTCHMSIDAGTPIKDLTITQQQTVGIVKAISYHSRTLVIDEPTSSISDKEVEFLFSTARELIKKSAGIIYISHKMDELGQTCNRVAVLRDGTYVGTERMKDTTRDYFTAMMVGRELTKYYTRGYMEPGRVVLKCENIVDGKMVKRTSLELREGEIIGFAGLVGAGGSETMKCIFGLTPGCTGETSVDGKKAAIKSPIDAMKFGIALAPEDRKQGGLYKVQSIRFNSTIEVLKSFIKGIWMDADEGEEITRQYIEMMDTKTLSQEQLIGNLSEGNQQKAMIGKWSTTVPKILILDEPTRGVDMGAKSGIYGIMNELVKKGVSTIATSSELPKILNMSDRVYVTCDGRIIRYSSHEERVTQEQIMKLAAKQEKGEGQVTTRSQKNVKQYFKDSTGIIGALLILCIFLSVLPRTSGSFPTQKNIFNVSRQISSNLLLACGMTTVIILEGTNLSVGSVIALSGCFVAGCVSHYGLPTVVGVLGGALVGTVVSMFNDVAISKTTVPPSTVIPATMSVAKGPAYVYTGGSPVHVAIKEWQFLGVGYVGGVPTPVILLTAVLVITAIIMNKTKLGRHIYVAGGDSQAARFSGISTTKVKFLVYTCSGIMVGLVGVVLTSRTYSGQSTAGDGAEMDTIAAVAVGGTSMAGGSGKIGGTIIGSLIIGMLNNGLNLLNIGSSWQYVVKGTVILLVVFVDYLRNKKAEQSLVYGRSVS